MPSSGAVLLVPTTSRRMPNIIRKQIRAKVNFSTGTISMPTFASFMFGHLLQRRRLRPRLRLWTRLEERREGPAQEKEKWRANISIPLHCTLVLPTCSAESGYPSHHSTTLQLSTAITRNDRTEFKLRHKIQPLWPQAASLTN